MRLNRIESFYAFLLRFRSEGSPCKGQPGMATTSPLARVVGHLQGGDRLQLRPPYRGAADCDQAPCKGRPAVAKAPMQRGGLLWQSPLQRGGRLWPVLARKGGDARPRPDCKGSCPRVAGCRAAPARGGSRPRPRRRGFCQRSADGRPRPAHKGRSTVGRCQGGARGGVGRRGGRPLAEWLPAGKGSRRLHRGSGSGGAVRVKEG
ncbi:hypothetical protein BHM03_00053081 [Ensete ventricosum]|nr:hypothetical protein BHM03_00053081 [Ensete ventricosum]